MRFKPSICLIAFAAALPIQSYGQQLKQSDEPGFYAESGFVVASGKWKAEDGSVDDSSVVEIHCVKGFGCYAATAIFLGDSSFGTFKGKPILDVGLSEYKIVRWDKDGIVAEDKAPICVSRRLIITFADKSVKAVDSPQAAGRGDPFCKSATHVKTHTLVAKWPHAN
jgi:hypothetical protein